MKNMILKMDSNQLMIFDQGGHKHESRLKQKCADLDYHICCNLMKKYNTTMYINIESKKIMYINPSKNISIIKI